MKKVIFLSMALILLATLVVPVKASDLSSNGRGNGGNSGQGNQGGNGNQDQLREKDKDKDRDRNKNQDQLRDKHMNSSNHGRHESKRMRTPFYLQGTISFVITDTLTVTVTHGNSPVKEYLGSDLAILADENIQIFQITQGDEISGTVTADTSGEGDDGNDGTPSNRIPIEFGDLQNGQRVAIHGNLVDNQFIARLITVYIRAPSGDPYPEP